MTRRHAEKGATPRSAARGARPVPVRPQPPKLDGIAGGSHTDGAACEIADPVQMKREFEAMQAEVAVLRARVKELEANAIQVGNRLAWAIDSVQSILDGKG